MKARKSSWVIGRLTFMRHHMRGKGLTTPEHRTQLPDCGRHMQRGLVSPSLRTRLLGSLPRLSPAVIASPFFRAAVIKVWLA